MKIPQYSDYTLAALVLVGAAALGMVVVAVTNRGDITSATLVLGSLICFLSGIFVLTFSKGDTLDTRFTGLLAVQGTIDIARLCADLGVGGNAHMVPSEGEGRVQQVIPVSVYNMHQIPEDSSFITGESGNAVVIAPLGYPLLKMLESSGLSLPEEGEEVLASVREVCEEVLEVADHVSVLRTGESIVVEFTGYRLFSGCEEVRRESPKACTMCPCPVCSLVLCMLAKALRQTCTLDSITAEPKEKRIRLVIALLP